MTVSSGFFNGADRPSNASEICSMFDGVITDGIFSTIGDLFVVLAAGGNNLSIGSGKAWFHHSWLKNDATIIKEAEAAEVLLNRIDIVVLEFDSSDPVRDNNIKIIKGTPATNPVAPTLANGPLKFQHKIAEVSRAAGSTEILQIHITPFQGTTGTPLITGLVQQADITTILQQFTSEMIDLQEQYADALLTIQQNGIPVHHGNHSTNSSDPIDPSDIGAASLVNGIVKASQARVAINPTKAANFTLSVNDAEKFTPVYTGTSAIVVTIPRDVAGTIPNGTSFTILRIGINAVSFVFESGLSVFTSNAALNISVPGNIAVLTRISNTEYWLSA